MTGEAFQPLPSKQATISDTKQQSLIAASIVSDDTIAPRSLTMDFSSVNRSLESLHRRRPELDAEILDLATALLQQDVSADDYLASLVKLLEAQDRWEPLAVGLYVATNIIECHTDAAGAVYVEGPRVPTISTSTDSPAAAPTFSQQQLVQLSRALLETCKNDLEHKEPRVRTLVAKAVGAVVALREVELQQVIRELHDSIIASIHRLLKEGRDNSEAYSKSSAGALDDTTGWRSLETNWQALASYIAANGSDYFLQHSVDLELLQACEYSSIAHVNRHVRAAGIAVLEQWIKIAPAPVLQESDLRETTVKVLKDSLADNWSQVRMAASVLCRTFFLQLQHYDIHNLDKVYAVLVPRMCLNRFYLAQGVKLYSHDTWKLVFPKGGVDIVANCAGAVCRYYIKMCDADNHVVREAACQAVAELATKLGADPKHKEKLQPFVNMLLQALIVCFHDESWPVRDEACLACGIFCKAYPNECLEELDMLKEKWVEQLTDQIWSVRQDAGVALADAMEAYGDDMLNFLLDILKEKIPSAREQPSMSREEYLKKQNDIESHTDSQLYSCGSLAPKLKKGSVGRKEGAGRIGCSSCDITRPRSPWEATDGCIYLLREILVKRPDLSDDIVLPLLTELADVCRVKHFPQGDDLRTTLWRQLPYIATTLGKQRFKRLYLGLFLDLLMQNLEESTASALSKHAAGQCAEELAQLVGPRIFRGRLDDFQQAAFDQAMLERERAPKGPAVDDFSPFGPAGLLDTRPNADMPSAPGMPSTFPAGGQARAITGSGYSDSL